MMSNRIITAVTLAAVSLHVLLGCCWHHGHQCETGVVAANASVETCPYHDHSHSSDDDSQHKHHDHSGDCCDGAACTFYAPDDSDSALSVILSFWLPIADSNNFASVLASVQEIRIAEVCVDDGIPLPEPLHALKQVWLI